MRALRVALVSRSRLPASATVKASERKQGQIDAVDDISLCEFQVESGTFCIGEGRHQTSSAAQGAFQAFCLQTVKC